MNRVLSIVSIVSLGWMLTACQHLDLAGSTSADRVLNGIVTSRDNGQLPPNCEVTVRVLDLSQGENQPDVLGEQTIANPSAWPVPFRIEYRADDAVLLRNVTVDVRVSVAGRLRYTTRTAHPVTLGNFNDRHLIEVAPAAQPEA